MSDTIEKGMKELSERQGQVKELLNVKDALLKVGVFTPSDIQVLKNLDKISGELIKTAEAVKNKIK